MSKPLNLTEVIQKISKKTGIEKSEVKKVLEANAELAEEQLKETESFNLFGVGKLKIKISGTRKGRNPRTGEEVIIPESKRVSLTVGKQFKERVQK